jgi:muramoyltetrapeptide carboxypeptidase
MHIGLFSPSAPIAAFCPRRLDRGIRALMALGHNVTVGSSVKGVCDFMAGSQEVRAQDLHNLFSHPEIDLIMTTIGGYSSNDLLNILDYEWIRQHKKPFVGFSDVTILLHALQARSGIQTILGPMLLNQFGEFPVPDAFTVQSFTHVLAHLDDGTVYELPTADSWTEELLMWDTKDDRPRVHEPNQGWRVLREGRAEGFLSGGNLETLLLLTGTPYQPLLDETILFLEDNEMEVRGSIQRNLVHLKQCGCLQQVRGIVFGRFKTHSEISSVVLSEIIDRVFGSTSIPVIMGVDFGHTDPHLTLPFGKRVQIETNPMRIQIIL